MKTQLNFYMQKSVECCISQAILDYGEDGFTLQDILKIVVAKFPTWNITHLTVKRLWSSYVAASDKVDNGENIYFGTRAVFQCAECGKWVLSLDNDGFCESCHNRFDEFWNE